MEIESRPRHPIRVVARRTGLTPATIRAWERRYDVVAPVRSDGGQRLYSDRDVTRLDTLRQLTELGRSISSVAALSPDAAAALLAEEGASAVASVRPLRTQDSPEPWTREAYDRLRGMDDAGLERTLLRALSTLGARQFLDGVAVPLLRLIGSGWVAGEISPAQEHLGSGVIERVLADLGHLGIGDEQAPRLVVGTLQGERHALGARLVAAAAALEGWRTSYLGVDLPSVEIARAADALGADALAISIVSDADPRMVTEELATLRSALAPQVALLVGGRGAEALDIERLAPGATLAGDLDELRSHLQAHG